MRVKNEHELNKSINRISRKVNGQILYKSDTNEIISSIPSNILELGEGCGYNNEVFMDAVEEVLLLKKLESIK